jgi:hypothetical protein
MWTCIFHLKLVFKLWPKTFGSEVDNLIPNHKNPTKKDELTFDESVWHGVENILMKITMFNQKTFQTTFMWENYDLANVHDS